MTTTRWRARRRRRRPRAAGGSPSSGAVVADATCTTASTRSRARFRSPRTSSSARDPGDRVPSAPRLGAPAGPRRASRRGSPRCRVSVVMRRTMPRHVRSEPVRRRRQRRRPLPGRPAAFRDLVRMLGNQPAAVSPGTRSGPSPSSSPPSGVSEPNPDPLERIAPRAARPGRRAAGRPGHRAADLGHGPPGHVVPVTRALWIHGATDAYRPLFEALAGSLAGRRRSHPPSPEDGGRPDGRDAAPGHGGGGTDAPVDHGRVDARPPRPAQLRPATTSRSPARRPTSSCSWPRTSGSSARRGACPTTTSSSGSASTRSPTTPSSASPTSAPPSRACSTAYAAGFEPGAGGSASRRPRGPAGRLSLDDPASLAELQASFADPAGAPRRHAVRGPARAAAPARGARRRRRPATSTGSWTRSAPA